MADRLTPQEEITMEFVNIRARRKHDHSSPIMPDDIYVAMAWSFDDDEQSEEHGSWYWFIIYTGPSLQEAQKEAHEFVAARRAEKVLIFKAIPEKNTLGWH